MKYGYLLIILGDFYEFSFSCLGALGAVVGLIPLHLVNSSAAVMGDWTVRHIAKNLPRHETVCLSVASAAGGVIYCLGNSPLEVGIKVSAVALSLAWPSFVAQLMIEKTKPSSSKEFERKVLAVLAGGGVAAITGNATNAIYALATGMFTTYLGSLAATPARRIPPAETPPRPGQTYN